MNTNKLVLLIITILLLFVSCKKPSTPTSPTFHVQVTMAIVPYQTAPANVDSTLSYTREFVEWNSSSFRDTTKADSLAQWFAQSSYHLTDMWFPDVGSRCGIPEQTENIVSIQLETPDTSFKALGYTPETAIVSPCFVYYRHYVFTKVQNGV